MYNIFFLLLVITTCLSAEPLYVFPLEEQMTAIPSWQVHIGDLNDSGQQSMESDHWPSISQTEIWKEKDGEGTGIRWYKQSLFFPEPLPIGEGLSIYIPALLTSYEVYWDGVFVGSSGVVFQKSITEEVGKSGQLFTLSPEQSSTGQHNLALRVSSHNTVSGALSEPISIGSTKNVVHKLFQQLGTSLFLGGVFAITALFHLFIVGSRKQQYAHIIFSLFALSCGGHILIRSLIDFGEINLNYYYPLAIAGDLFWFGIIAFLPLFLLSHFGSHGRKYTATLVVVLSAAVVALPRLALYDILPIRFLPALNDLNLFYAYFSVIGSIVIVVGSLIRKRKGSKTIFSGMMLFLVGLIITTVTGISNGWTIGFAFLTIFITIAIARQFAEERRNFHKSELRSSRLELELLKKHIQPHFLLNSLNSIVAWIEEEPEVAGKLVNALSQELRLLMAFASEPTINLSQEIKICKVHLQVMSMRQEKQFTLNLNGIKEGITIPPFILHTLIENGISHGFRKQDEGTFTLTTTRNNGKVILKLHNNGSPNARKTSEGEGTGTRYIRSRLQEMCRTDYTFHSQSVEDGWESIITFSERIR